MGCASSQSHTNKPLQKPNNNVKENVKTLNQQPKNLQQNKQILNSYQNTNNSNNQPIKSTNENKNQNQSGFKQFAQQKPKTLEKNIKASQQKFFEKNLNGEFDKIKQTHQSINEKNYISKQSDLRQKIKNQTGLDRIDEISKSSQFKHNNGSLSNTPLNQKRFTEQERNELSKSHLKMKQNENKQQYIHQQTSDNNNQSYKPQYQNKMQLKPQNINNQLHQSQIQIKVNESNISGINSARQECFDILQEEYLFFGEGFNANTLIIDMNAIVR